MKFYELVSTMRKDGYSERDIVDELGFESVSQFRKCRALSVKKHRLSIYNRLEKLSARNYPDSLIAEKMGISETQLNNIREVTRYSSAKKWAQDCAIRLVKKFALESDYKARYANDENSSSLMSERFQNDLIRNSTSLFNAVMHGGSAEETRRIAEFIMVCIKARDMNLDWFRCYIDNGIEELEKKYSVKIRRF